MDNKMKRWIGCDYSNPTPKGFGVDWPNGKPDRNAEPLELDTTYPKTNRERYIFRQGMTFGDRVGGGLLFALGFLVSYLLTGGI